MSRETILSILNVIKFGGNGFTGIAITWIFLLFFIRGLCFFCAQHNNNFKNFAKLFSPKIFIIIYISYIIGYLNYTTRYFKIQPFIPEVKDILSLNINIIKELYTNKYNGYNRNLNYKDYITYKQGDNKSLNIILIFAESLSAIDSETLGGNNNIPNFDKIQKSGIIFTNFISNGSRSVSAHFSLSIGIPSFEGFYPDYLQFIKDFSKNNIIEPLPTYLNKIGYKTTYISAAPLTFLNERELFTNFGFQKIIGEEAFEQYKKYSCNAAADEKLFERILNEVQVQTGKYFINASTATFHEPYYSPYGQGESSALKYFDDNLYKFYQGLQNLGFFDNGILIIVGDHRKRTPIQEKEYDLFGPSWDYRAAATIVGSGIQPGTINSNLIQHTDFYNSIKRFVGNGMVAVDNVYNDIFTQQVNRNWGILNGSFLIPENNSFKRINYKIFENLTNESNYFGGLNNLFIERKINKSYQTS